MRIRGRKPGQPTPSNLLILPDSKWMSSGIPRVEFGQLRPGIEFHGVAVGLAGRRQVSRVGLQGWLHGPRYIGTGSPPCGRTTSPRWTGHPLSRIARTPMTHSYDTP